MIGFVDGRSVVSAGFRVEGLEHRQLAHLGQVLVDRVLEAELPLLDELHQRERGDRLRHRRDAEHRVDGHRPLAGYVRDTERAAIKNVLAIGDERHDTGYVAALDGGAQRSVDRGDRRLRVRVREEYDDGDCDGEPDGWVRFMDPPLAGCECLPLVSVAASGLSR